MRSIFFVSNNKERIIPEELMRKIFKTHGMDHDYYHISPDVFGLSQDLSSYQLLKQRSVADLIEKKRGQIKPNLLVFKNSKLIEDLCKKRGYNLLSSSAEITSYLENKITQSEFLEKNKIPKPFTVWGTFEDMDFYRIAKKIGLPFILQFGRGHSGLGSIMIVSQEQYRDLVEQFPLREVRCSKLVKAEVGTVNACIGKDDIYIGAPSLQITGVEKLTKNQLSTVGNDWGYIQKLLKENKLESKFRSFVNKVGRAMRKLGYLGIFGIDFSIEVNEEEIFKVIEINARFPASLVSETEMAYKDDNPLLILLHIKQFLNDVAYTVDTAESKTIPYYPRSRLIYRDHKTNEEVTSMIFDEAVYEGRSHVNDQAIQKLTKKIK